MTTRQTSMTAYRQLVASGVIKGNQDRVLAHIVDYGPATSGEILFRMNVRNVNAWRARFTELQARGLITEVEQRKCTITGRLALVWEFTKRTTPLSVKKGHRTDGKAWRSLALALWTTAKALAEDLGETEELAEEGFEERIRALGGSP